jgi:hypothetical protein
MKTILFIILYCFSLVCLSGEPLPRFDLTLVREWTKDSRHPQDPPYVFSLAQGDYSLKYIAAKHSSNLMDPLFSLITKTVEEHKPKIVVIEGVPTSIGINNLEILKSAENCSKKSNPDTFVCGEPLFLVLLAHAKGISFVGGEPDFIEISQQLISLGLNQQEILFFHVARNLFGMKRSGELTLSNLEIAYASQLKKYAATQSNYTFDQFKAWYKQELKKDFTWDGLINPDYAPFKTGHKLNQIAFAIDEVRERNILKTIEQSLIDYKHVLVLYGSGHLFRHQLVLENAFKAR